MIVTEAEAISVQCPMMFDFASINEDGRKTNGCLGSACMAWRWENHEENMRIDGLPDDAYRSKDLLDPRGFCGLAGDLRRKDPR
jgi:hypothetical protein